MFLDIGRPVPPKAKFDVPHLGEPLRFKDIQKEFPEFAKLFDGQAVENTLLFYWKFDKTRGVYEFKDAESEDEVAELMGVNIAELPDEDEDEQPENRPLTENEIDEWKEHMDDIRKGREWLDKNKN